MRYQVIENAGQEHSSPWAVRDTQLMRVARYTETKEEAEDLARKANAGYWDTCQQQCKCGRVCGRTDDHETHQCSKCDYDSYWALRKVNGTGATFPCRKCGLSARNSVHRNRNQFGYHAFESKEDLASYSSFSQEALEEDLHNLFEEVKSKTGATDDQINEALAEVAKKFMNTNCMKNPEV
jgi:hypothetical protein